ncbi:unnamed protein product [Hymenolepis diminuta]|uniref:Uncharacterized protein n=1 Tax=Hymenolepis diminuta TaxID=6216 RepID=A0A564ZD18_HYMDI|nr:unnamed protein product [Hymenolepis diminuta]
MLISGHQWTHATKADLGDLTCARTFWKVWVCNRSRSDQARPCVLWSSQPISDQYPCSVGLIVFNN